MDTLKKQTTGFTQISNDLLSNESLSFKAKGIYAYLFSKPDNWEFSGDRIAKQTQDGRKAIYTGLKELETYNYIKRKKLPSGKTEYLLLCKPNAQKGQQGKKPNAQNGKEPKRQLAEMGSISNKENIVIKNNSNKDIAKQSFAEWDSNNYIEELINSKQPHISLIGKYFKQRTLKFPDKEAAQAEIRRWAKDAKFISKYNQEEINQVFTYVSTNYPQLWNLSTMRKYIADPIKWT